MRKLLYVLAAFVVPYYSARVPDLLKVDRRVGRSAQVVNEIMGTPDKGVPQDLLDEAV